MSVTHAHSEPDDLALHVPPEMADEFAEIDQHLTEAGKQWFHQELLDATLEALKTRNARALNATIEAWYRTLRFKRAGVDEILRQDPAPTPTGPEDGMTAAQVRKYVLR